MKKNSTAGGGSWLIHYLPTLLWAGFVFVLLGIPGSFFSRFSGNASFPHMDKIVHAGIFAVLMFFSMVSSAKHYHAKPFSKYTLIAFIIALLLAVATELFQKYYTTTRSGDIQDIFADIAGCMLGFFMFYLYNLIFFKKRH